MFCTVQLADITPFLVLTLGDEDLSESSVVPAALAGERFRDAVGRYDARELDEAIITSFEAALREDSALPAVEGLLDDIGQRRVLGGDLRERARHVIGQLRDLMARASVRALEPDLIILDEFQRFRHLLDRNTGGEAAELAHHLFEWGQARTLLLSATPYKPFTLTEEDEEGEDHYGDFMTTLAFLASQDQTWLSRVQRALSAYRSLLLAGRPCDEVVGELRGLLLRYMCRTERPEVKGTHVELSTPVSGVTASDLVDYVGLRDLAEIVGSHVQVEYWKSAPYFVNFLEGYHLGERLKVELKRHRRNRALEEALGRVSRLDAARLERYEPCDMGNARLRALAQRTVEDGWWQLLWLPPSMPYVTPEGPYAEPFAQRITKQLIFSSWSPRPQRSPVC